MSSAAEDVWPLEAGLRWLRARDASARTHADTHAQADHGDPDTRAPTHSVDAVANNGSASARPGLRQRRASGSTLASTLPSMRADTHTHTRTPTTSRPQPPSTLWLLLLVATYVRCALMLHPHSGQGRPPMFGDFEAQRHWMEVTLRLRPHEWYVHSRDNDLMYWGMDYPPLTAYTSWAFGKVAQRVEPQLVAWGASRGYEAPRGKLFMRVSVLLCDLLAWLPAVYAVSAAMLPHPQSAWRRMALLASLLFVPALLLVDHGHFQYNNVSLGLCVAALAAVAWERWLLCAALFSLALNFKQMSLYYSLAYFVLLLIVGARDHVLPARLQPTGRALRAVTGVALIGCVVLAVFAVLWMPFCVSALAYDSANATCIRALADVLRRLFPFDRSLFEDKVSNLWCALEPLLKLRHHIYGDPTGAWRARVAGVSALVTLALCVIPLLLLVLAAVRVRPANTVEAATSRSATATRAPRQDATPHVAPAEPAWALVECTALALFATACAFFLASYQVHEKSILLPLVPLACLAHRLPLFAAWMNILAALSMWPLLQKDGLLLATGCVVLLYYIAFWPSARAVAANDASYIVCALPLAYRSVAARRWAAHGLLALAWLSIAVVASTLLATYALDAPARLPDLFPYASAVACAASLTGAMVASWWILRSVVCP